MSQSRSAPSGLRVLSRVPGRVLVLLDLRVTIRSRLISRRLLVRRVDRGRGSRRHWDLAQHRNAVLLARAEALERAMDARELLVGPRIAVLAKPRDHVADQLAGVRL